MKLLKYISTVLFSLAIALAGHAQEFAITKVELTGVDVILHYDLNDTAKSRTYSIQVYASKDNFLSPLIKITGDAGLEVKPGQNKKIVWSAKEELGNGFHGDIELEVRGRVYIPFVKFNDFDNGLVIRRGKATTLTWSGGTRQNILNFSIYKGGEFITVIPNIANTGSYDIVLPTSIKPGKGYRFVVTDNKNKDQAMQTSLFEVRRKIPLLVKVVPVVLIGAAVPLLLPKNSDSSLDGPPGVPSGKD